MSWKTRTRAHLEAILKKIPASKAFDDVQDYIEELEGWYADAIAERDAVLSGATLRKSQADYARAAERNVELERERDEAVKNSKEFQRDWLEVVDLCNAARDQRDEWKGKAEEAQGVAVWAVKRGAYIGNQSGRVLEDPGGEGIGTDADIYRVLLEARKGGKRDEN